MKNQVLRTILLWSVVLIPQAAPLRDSGEANLRTPDGRFDTQCFLWGNDSRPEFCEVSFYRLLAAPEKYHGRLVGVVGFLVSVFGRPVLFATRESYEANADYEGLVLVNAKLPESIASKIRFGVSRVVVIGVFDAKDIGDRLPRLGSLTDIESVFVTSRFPPRVNKPERKSIEK